MSRNNKHLIGSVTLTGEITQADVDAGRQLAVGTKVWKIESLCGEKWSGQSVYGEAWADWKFGDTSPSAPYGYATFDWQVDCCSKCQSKALQRKLKASPIGYSLGGRVDLSVAPLPYGLRTYPFKSVYPVSRDSDNQIVGFITIEDGWGKKWGIYGWGSNLRMGDMDKGEMPDPVMDTGEVLKVKKLKIKTDKTAPDEYDTYESTMNRITSKEAALLLFPELDKQGKLRTEAEVRASDAKTMETWTRNKVEREAQRAIDAQRREDERIAAQNQREALITDIRDVLFNDENLSNFARDVLFRTAKAAGITEDELMTANPLADETAPSEPETDEWGVVISQ